MDCKLNSERKENRQGIFFTGVMHTGYGGISIALHIQSRQAEIHRTVTEEWLFCYAIPHVFRHFLAYGNFDRIFDGIADFQTCMQYHDVLSQVRQEAVIECRPWWLQNYRLLESKDSDSSIALTEFILTNDDSDLPKRQRALRCAVFNGGMTVAEAVAKNLTYVDPKEDELNNAVDSRCADKIRQIAIAAIGGFPLNRDIVDELKRRDVINKVQLAGKSKLEHETYSMFYHFVDGSVGYYGSLAFDESLKLVTIDERSPNKRLRILQRKMWKEIVFHKEGIPS